jgi:hypothetical protein
MGFIMKLQVSLIFHGLSAMAFVLLASCESPSKVKVLRSVKPNPESSIVQGNSMVPVKVDTLVPAKVDTPVKPKGLTPEEKALSDQLSKEYYTGLVASIQSLDDGISPAESIARAAISQNIQLMKDWKRAQMAGILREFPGSGLKIENAISELPSRGHIDEAMAAVLTLRKRQNETVIEP